MEQDIGCTVTKFDAALPLLLADVDHWYETKIKPLAELDNPENEEQASTLYSALPVITSKRILDLSAYCEKHLGVRIPPIIIKKGGYSSLDEAKSDLFGKLRSVLDGSTSLSKKQQKLMKPTKS